MRGPEAILAVVSLSCLLGGGLLLAAAIAPSEPPSVTLPDPCQDATLYFTRAPQGFVTHVSAWPDRPVAPDEMDLVSDALAVYGLPIMLEQGRGTPGLTNGVAHVDLVIVRDALVDSGQHLRKAGMECRGQIYASFLSGHADRFQHTVIHEFGHALGMCHEQDTYMDTHAPATAREFETRSQFNAHQEAYIDRFDRPGTRIVEMGPCV